VRWGAPALIAICMVASELILSSLQVQVGMTSRSETADARNRLRVVMIFMVAGFNTKIGYVKTLVPDVENLLFKCAGFYS